MTKQTPLYAQHLAAGAKIVEFAGWKMPIQYESLLAEHKAVRTHVGMFDVSHMAVIDVLGEQAQSFLRHLLANDVKKLIAGQALYSCMLNPEGGIIDDLIAYCFSAQHMRLVVNASTVEKDIAWLQQQAPSFSVVIQHLTNVAIIAVQGPNALTIVKQVVNEQQRAAIESLAKAFYFSQSDGWMFARTGYTGEEGLEIILPNDEAPKFWQTLIMAGVTPCGLGARDTLRLEAGLNLYGTDMQENHTPFESNLAWTVDLTDPDRMFIGREALEGQQKKGVQQKLIGLELLGPGVMRNHQKLILVDGRHGEITSGTFSPTLGKSIAMARAPIDTEGEISVEIRNKKIPAKLVPLPFLKRKRR